VRSSLTLVTGPAAEPVILQEAKNWTKIDTTDDDALLASLITAATQSAEEFRRRSLISQTWKFTLDLPYCRSFDLAEGVYDLPVSALYGELPQSVALPKGPLQSVSSVKTYDTSNNESTYSSSNYFVDAAGDRLVLNETAVWPSPLRDRAAVAINYVAGYGDTSSAIPMPIKTAILMHVKKMYDCRDWCEMPEGCERLLRQYRKMGNG
jgi:hypothetical protein